MSLSAKRESLAQIHGRYQRAGRPHKTRLLDEFCATCGYHRKAALRLLNRSLPTTSPKRPGPKRTYDPAQVLPVLKAVWLASDQLCSKLLKAALSEWLEYYERRAAPLPEAFKPNPCNRNGQPSEENPPIDEPGSRFLNPESAHQTVREFYCNAVGFRLASSSYVVCCIVWLSQI